MLVIVLVCCFLLVSYIIAYARWGSNGKLLHPLRLTMEAIVVGCGLVALFFALHALFMNVYGDKAMTNHALLALQVFLAGAIFHGLFEITTGNHAYCAQRK